MNNWNHTEQQCGPLLEKNWSRCIHRKNFVTDNIRSGVLFDQLGLDITDFDKSRDRIMICGGPSFNNEIRDMLEEKGWMHGTMRSQRLCPKNVHLWRQ